MPLGQPPAMAGWAFADEVTAAAKEEYSWCNC